MDFSVQGPADPPFTGTVAWLCQSRCFPAGPVLPICWRRRPCCSAIVVVVARGGKVYAPFIVADALVLEFDDLVGLDGTSTCAEAALKWASLKPTYTP